MEPTTLLIPCHEPCQRVTTDTIANVDKSSNTAPTYLGSSEEFSVSAEMPTTPADDGPVLQLSNMSIVHENASSCQPLLEATAEEEPSGSHDDNDEDAQMMLPVNDNSNSSCKVRFLATVTFITEDDIAVDPPLNSKKTKKDKKLETDNDESDHEVLPTDIWWSQQELEAIERNAMYMVKESQQYQEEVIVTVLYNKAFLSAANLAESISEEDLHERLQNIADHSNTLDKWTEVGNSRRGLENMVSEKAIENAIQARAMVLQLQKELRSATALEAAEHEQQEQTAELLLARKCQDATRHSRIMARMMGQADASALAKAEALSAEGIRLPEPPGRYSGDHEEHTEERAGRISRKSRRGTLVESIKKGVGNVFKRQGSREVNIKRIRKLQQKRMQEEEPPKRPSQEFRKSFLDSLDYGEQ